MVSHVCQWTISHVVTLLLSAIFGQRGLASISRKSNGSHRIINGHGIVSSASRRRVGGSGTIVLNQVYVLGSVENPESS